jgi:hypothetical protein
MTTPKLHLAKGLDLPIAAVTQTFAFMGKRGAGKTYAAGKLVEEMLGAGAQVVVIDPVGNWWGLRLGADGKRAGLSIPVFGGAHGDIDLAPHAGELVADVVVDTGTSVVLDVSHFRKGQRKDFVTAFAEQLFHRKKTKRTPLHVVFEEAHVFAPQRAGIESARLLGAIEDLIKLGRNYGIGASLLDQRPQAVNKDVLNQSEVLLAFQLIGAQERKSIAEWAEDKGIGKDGVKRLSELRQGQALVWSPTWLEVFEVFTIAKKTTFDASSTPELGGDDDGQRALAAVDLGALQKAMASVVEEKKAADPKALRKRIHELERELHEAKKAPPAPRSAAAPAAPSIVDFSLVSTTVAELRRLADRLERHVGAAVAGHARTPRTVPASAPAPKTNGHAHAPTSAAAEVGKGPAAMLQALASFHPKPLSKNQLATLAGYSPRSSTTRNYLSALRSGGYITTVGDRISMTPAGVAAAGPPQPTSSTPELLEMWCPKVGGGPAEILKLLVERYPDALGKDLIERATGYSATSSTMRNYLSILSRNGLLERTHDGVRASSTLFPGGA